MLRHWVSNLLNRAESSSNLSRPVRRPPPTHRPPTVHPPSTHVSLSLPVPHTRDKAENCAAPPKPPAPGSHCVLPGDIGATTCSCQAPPSCGSSNYPAAEPGMKQMLVIGDSISYGQSVLGSHVWSLSLLSLLSRLSRFSLSLPPPLPSGHWRQYQLRSGQVGDLSLLCLVCLASLASLSRSLARSPPFSLVGL